MNATLIPELPMFLAAALLPFTVGAQPARLVSAPDPGLVAGRAATANGDSEAARFSRDGRFLVFTSEASNLVTNDLNGIHLDVFVRDLAAGRTFLVSATPSGISGSGDSYGPDISADGRYIAFLSRAPDLVEGDTNQVADVFVHDSVDGITRRVSIATDGTAADGESFAPRMTPDGRFVCFGSRASNLDSSVPDADGRVDVFVRDLVQGVTTLASAEARAGAELDIQDYAMSDDGGWVVFTTPSTNVVATPVQGLATTAHLRDLAGGVTTRIDVPSAALPSHTSLLEVTSMAFAPGGTRLAVSAWPSGASSPATNVVQVHDLVAGVWTRRIAIQGLSGTRLDSAADLVFSRDGETLAMVQSRTRGQPGVLQLWNETSGVSTPVNSTTGQPVRAREIALSPDGKRLVFTSLGTDLVQGGTPALIAQLYLLEASGGPAELLNTGITGGPAGGVETAGPVFSPDGNRIAFHSGAPDLVAGDRNGRADVFLLDLGTRARQVVSAPVGRASASGQGLGSLMARGVSADGRYVLFASTADDLARNDSKGVIDLFVRDLLRGRTHLVTESGVAGGPSRPGFTEAVLSNNGRFVAYTADHSVERADGLRVATPGVFLRDLARGRTRILTTDPDGRPLVLRAASNLRLSADGRYVAYYQSMTVQEPTPPTLRQVILQDVGTDRHWVVASLDPTTPSPHTVSLAGLGGRVVVSPSASAVFQATVFDPVTETRESFAGARGTVAALSYDGRRTVLVTPGDAGEGPAVVWHDVGVGPGGPLRPAVEPGRTHAFEALSMDGRWLVLRERNGSVTSIQPRNSTLAIHLPAGQAGPLEVDPTGALAGPRVVPGTVTLSADGGLAAFQSSANNLVPWDPNAAVDVFLRAPATGPTIRIPRTPDLPTDAYGAVRPLLSADGGTLVFFSWSPAFSRDDGNAQGDVFALGLSIVPPADTDTDGLDDRWEMAWFGNLLRDGGEDGDTDGASDRDEYQAGTCPIDDVDRFRVVVGPGGEGGLVVEWDTRAGRRYRVRASDGVGVGGVWTVVGDAVTGDGAVARVELFPSVGTARFFRVEVERVASP